MKKENAPITQRLDEQREAKEGADYERDGFEGKLQRAHRERDKCIDAVNRAQSGVGELQGVVKKDCDDLQKRTEKSWARMCQKMGTLLAKRIVGAREDQIRHSRGVAALYVHS